MANLDTEEHRNDRTIYDSELRACDSNNRDYESGGIREPEGLVSNGPSQVTKCHDRYDSRGNGGNAIIVSSNHGC